MHSEDKEMLMSMAKKIDSLIDKEFEKLGMDRSYFNFKLSVELLGSGFCKLEETVLLEDGQAFCNFCGQKTTFYDNIKNMHLCASCFSKVDVQKNQ